MRGGGRGKGRWRGRGGGRAGEGRKGRGVLFIISAGMQYIRWGCPWVIIVTSYLSSPSGPEGQLAQRPEVGGDVMLQMLQSCATNWLGMRPLSRMAGCRICICQCVLRRMTLHDVT